MKASQKITRVKLKINYENDFVLLGIVAHEPDYKLSLTLNRKLNISLKNTTPVTITQRPYTELTFSRFSDLTASPALVYDLFSNRTGKQFLLRKLKNIDYIFRIHNPDNTVDAERIISLLREIECISAVFKLDPGSIRDRNINYITL